MRIESIQSHLRTVALLAKEYNAKINASEVQEIRRLESVINNGHRISKYERLFLKAVRDIKQTILEQIDFFAKKLVEQFAKYDEGRLDIDERKVAIARRCLSKDEFDLLGSLFKFQVYQQHLEKRRGRYREVKITELEPELERFVGVASARN